MNDALAAFDGMVAVKLIEDAGLDAYEVSLSRRRASFTGPETVSVTVRVEREHRRYAVSRSFTYAGVGSLVYPDSAAETEACLMREDMLRGIAKQTATESRVLELEAELAGLRSVGNAR